MNKTEARGDHGWRRLGTRLRPRIAFALGVDVEREKASAPPAVKTAG